MPNPSTKKATMGPVARGVLRTVVFVLVLALLLWGLSLLRPADRVLTVLTTDASFQTDFPAPASINERQWTTLERTNYQDGEVSSVTHFTRRFPTRCEVRHINSDGTNTRYLYTLAGKETSFLYDLTDANVLEWMLPTGATLRCTGWKDAAGRISSYSLLDSAEKSLSHVTLDYAEENSDQIIQQIQVGSDGASQYQTHVYDNDRLAKTTTYLVEGEQPEETVLYTYSNHQITAECSGPDGTVLGTAVASTDLLDRPIRVEYRSSTGALLAQEVYHYSFWTLFTGNIGLFFLVIAAALALVIALQFPLPGKPKR